MRHAIALLFFLLVAVPAKGQVIVDGSAAEWGGTAPTTSNDSTYSSGTAAGLNEFIWADAEGDHRTDFNSNGPDVLRVNALDILELRLASSADSLYYLVVTDSSFNVASGNGAPFFQLSIQRPAAPANRNAFLAGNSNNLVPANAEWDFLAITRLGSGNLDHRIWRDSYAASSFTGRVRTGGNTESGYIEGSIPWDSLGGTPGAAILRMTASLFRANESDNAYTGGDNSRGGVMDFVTNTTGNTYGALEPANANGSQGRLDFALDVQFLESSAILPVELTAFEGTLSGNAARLSWVTASETNNAGFYVEHSANGAAFRDVHFAPGFGTTLEARSYAFTTPELAPGVHTFRLRQTDLDGATELSSTVELAVSSDVATLAVTPNPSRGLTNVSLAVPSAQQVTVSAYDVTGRLVTTLFRGAADASVAATLSDVAPGVYVIVAEGETFRLTTSATVLR